jgi:hypothetical protein
VPQDRYHDRKVGRTVLVRPVLGTALTALVLCTNSAAVRAGDDDSTGDESLLTKFERSIGLKAPGTMEYGINYGERSPLVVPPSRDLPPPQAAVAPAVPDWPKDPDVQKRAKVKKTDKVEPHADYVLESDRALRPDELNPGGVHRGNSPGANGDGTSGLPDDRYANSDAKKSWFSFDWFKKEEYATFTGEPRRSTLTDPPPGYLTPSPDQPYGVGPETNKAKVATPGDHGEVAH